MFKLASNLAHQAQARNRFAGSEIVAVVHIDLAVLIVQRASALHVLLVHLHVHCTLSNDIAILVFVGEAGPLARVLQALHVLRRQFHLCKFLWKMFGAVLVIKLRLIWCWLKLLLNVDPIDA